MGDRVSAEWRRRRWIKALIASLIFPGTGHIIVGKPWKAAGLQVLFIGLLFGLVLGRPDLLPVGLVAPLLVWVYSVVELLLTPPED